MYCTRWKRALALLLGAVLFCSLGPEGYTLEERPAEGQIIFSEVSALAENEGLQQTIVDSNGNEAVVGIRKIGTSRNLSRAAAAGETWQVWYRGAITYAEFYMTVSDNKVTSVYDEKISVTSGSYSNVKLTKTTTYGKLSFKTSAVGGLISGDCWLKGTVTGENDEIDVTWSM